MIVIDEVQKASALFPAIKRAVDRDRSPGRFLLTGSANVLMLPKISESLAGRMEIVTLHPLSRGEMAGRKERFIEAAFTSDQMQLSFRRSEENDLSEILSKGGFPEASARKSFARRRAWFSAYVTAILQRDVRDLANIEGLTDMPRLLSVLASRSGGLMNMSELSRTLGIPHTTLKRYLSLMEATFLLMPLRAWSANIGKRLIKAPKIFLTDSGLAAHLSGFNPGAKEPDSIFTGALLECFVLSELRKQATWSSFFVRLYHYRTTTGREVDFVLEDDAGRLVAVEVKAAHRVGRKDFSGIVSFAETVPDRFVRGMVLYAGSEAVSFGPNLSAVPLNALWA
jgi:predicted AAA+ superfamily ATPase